MGFYFGANELIDRFSLLKEEFSQITAINSNLSRAQIFKFGLNQFYNFFLFGYGPGSFETLFQINFKDSGILMPIMPILILLNFLVNLV